MPLDNPSAAAQISRGDYGGNDSANRAIPHGLTKTPVAVFIFSYDTVTPTISRGGYLLTLANRVISSQDLINGALAVTAMNSTNFYVGNATSYPTSANYSGHSYFWVAIA